MDTMKTYYEKLAATVISNLNKRQIEGLYCSTSQDAVKQALSLLPPNAVVGFGGSVTLAQSGMLDALKAEPSIKLLDREAAKTVEEKEEI